jgi:hypothetical protein
VAVVRRSSASVAAASATAALARSFSTICRSQARPAEVASLLTTHPTVAEAGSKKVS